MNDFDYWLKITDNLEKTAEEMLKKQITNATTKKQMYAVTKLYSLLLDCCDKLDTEYGLMLKKTETW